MKFFNTNIHEECNDENNDAFFDVGHRKWLKEIHNETGNAVVYWPLKPYLASTYAKKAKDPEEN